MSRMRLLTELCGEMTGDGWTVVVVNAKVIQVNRSTFSADCILHTFLIFMRAIPSNELD